VNPEKPAGMSGVKKKVKRGEWEGSGGKKWGRLNLVKMIEAIVECHR